MSFCNHHHYYLLSSFLSRRKKEKEGDKERKKKNQEEENEEKMEFRLQFEPILFFHPSLSFFSSFFLSLLFFLSFFLFFLASPWRAKRTQFFPLLSSFFLPFLLISLDSFFKQTEALVCFCPPPPSLPFSSLFFLLYSFFS